MIRDLVKIALVVGCAGFLGDLGMADAPAPTVKAEFKIYDKDGKVVADVNRVLPKHTDAFDGLRKTLSVDFDTYPGLGNFVTGIAGINQSPADNLYWMLYVDGTVSQVGIGNFYIDKDMVIEFKLEKPKTPSPKAGQKVTVNTHVADEGGKVLRRHKLEYTVPKTVSQK